MHEVVGEVVQSANDRLQVGKRVAVIGAGPIGLSFCHVLKQYGAGQVTAVDPVDRGDVAVRYGADEFVRMDLKHRQDVADYVSHVIPATEAQTAYALYARPQTGRLKVAIVNTQ